VSEAPETVEEEAESIRQRRFLQEIATVAFDFIESYENTIGTMRANKEYDEAYPVLSALYGFILGLSNMGSLGYGDISLYNIFTWWSNTLRNIKHTIEEWENDKYGAMTSAQIDYLTEVEDTLRIRLETVAQFFRDKGWPYPPIEELCTELKNTAVEERPYKLLSVVRHVLTLLEPLTWIDIYMFKNLCRKYVSPEYVSPVRERLGDWYKRHITIRGGEVSV
jgi:hypothetical protein